MEKWTNERERERERDARMCEGERGEAWRLAKKSKNSVMP